MTGSGFIFFPERLRLLFLTVLIKFRRVDSHFHDLSDCFTRNACLAQWAVPTCLPVKIITERFPAIFGLFMGFLYRTVTLFAEPFIRILIITEALIINAVSHRANWYIGFCTNAGNLIQNSLFKICLITINLIYFQTRSLCEVQ